jgi:hypothetical protein
LCNLSCSEFSNSNFVFGGGKSWGKFSASYRLPDSVEDGKFKIQDLTLDFMLLTRN